MSAGSPRASSHRTHQRTNCDLTPVPTTAERFINSILPPRHLRHPSIPPLEQVVTDAPCLAIVQREELRNSEVEHPPSVPGLLPLDLLLLLGITLLAPREQFGFSSSSTEPERARRVLVLEPKLTRATREVGTKETNFVSADLSPVEPSSCSIVDSARDARRRSETQLRNRVVRKRHIPTVMLPVDPPRALECQVFLEVGEEIERRHRAACARNEARQRRSVPVPSSV